MSNPSAPALPASLQSLPAELFFEILDYCQVKDLLSLWRCGGGMSERLEHILFCTDTRRHKMLYWACIEGDVDLLRRSIAFGASPSFIRSQISTPSLSIYPGPGPIRQLMGKDENDTTRCNVSSLSLVASLGHLDAFTALLELGADISLTKGPALNNILRLLRQRDGWPFLRALLNARQGPAIFATGDEWSNKQGIFLASLIAQKAPVDILQAMIDAGANINSCQPVTSLGRTRFTSPLEAAVEAGYVEAVNLLVGKGADIGDRTRAWMAEYGLYSDLKYGKLDIRPLITTVEQIS